MKTTRWIKTFLFIAVSIICLMYYAGVAYVPFHPDEATQIYTSGDTAKLTTNPLSLAFDPLTKLDERTRYRLIDSPITRLLIGIGLHNRGLSPTQTDWDWSKSWNANSNAGALPNSQVLYTSRLSVTWVFPISLLFLFLLTKRISDWRAASIAGLLFSTNALILLHTRRAMAESLLVFLFCASTWALLNLQKQIWLSALPIGLAINAKQSAFPLLGFGLFHTIFQPVNQWGKRILSVVLFASLVLIISASLNPVFWREPLSTMQAGIETRLALSNRMEEDYLASFHPVDQTAAIIGQVFYAQPAVWDVGNYREQTTIQGNIYFQNPINNLFRTPFWGTIFIFLTIFGWAILIRRFLKNQEKLRYAIGMFLFITLAFILFNFLFTPVHFQRYYIILIPLFIVAQSIAITTLAKIVVDLIQKRLPVRDSLPSRS